MPALREGALSSHFLDTTLANYGDSGAVWPHWQDAGATRRRVVQPFSGHYISQLRRQRGRLAALNGVMLCTRKGVVPSYA